MYVLVLKLTPRQTSTIARLTKERTATKVTIEQSHGRYVHTYVRFQYGPHKFHYLIGKDGKAHRLDASIGSIR